MKVIINDSTVVQFCKKYPLFSIEKLVLNYIKSIQDLNACDSSNLLQLVENTITASMQSNLINLTESIKDTTQTKLLDTLTMILRSVSNEHTIDTVYSIKNTVGITDSNLKELVELFKDYTSSFKNSSIKGHNTEVKTVMQLDNVFPKHDITHIPSSKQKGKMDMILSREGYPNISIDTKHYSKTVPKTEVAKFEQDMQIGNTHGIMISIDSKIACKPHFTINIINKHVAVYLSNTKGDTECIKIAVELVYNLSKIIETRGSNIDINPTQLNRIHTILKEDSERINSIKTHLETSLYELKQFSFNKIISVLNDIV